MSVNLGRVAYVEKGAYDVGTVYQKKDVVLFNNGSYVYINDIMSAGKPPTDTAYWQAMLDPTDMNAATAAANEAAENAEGFKAEISQKISQLSEENERHFRPSSNLLDESTIAAGNIDVSGNETESTTFKRSGYIGVVPGETYVANVGGYRCLYKADKTFAGRYSLTAKTPFEAKSEVEYIRIVSNSQSTAWQLNKGEILLDYEPFGDTLSNCSIAENIDATLKKQGMAADAHAVGQRLTSVPDLLPIPVFYHVVGHPNRLHFRNISYANVKDYVQDGIPRAFLGRDYMDYADMENTSYGNHTINRYTVKDLSHVNQIKYSFQYVEAGAKSGETINIMMIGDSTTAAGVTAAQLVNLCEKDGVSLQLIGAGEMKKTDKDGTVRTVRVEGRSGWSTDDYVTDGARADNPYITNGVFDFGAYMAAKGFGRPDWVTIQLGINDVERPGNNTTAANLTTMVNSIAAYDNTIKIAIALVLPPYLGENQSSTSAMYHQKRLAINEDILRTFVDDERVVITPINCYLDAQYGFPMEEEAVGGGISKTITGCTDGTHPSAEGYYQIAEAWFAMLMNN